MTVSVTPKVEVLKGGTAKLPCTYTVSPPTPSNTVVEWYIVSHFQIFRFYSFIYLHFLFLIAVSLSYFSFFHCSPCFFRPLSTSPSTCPYIQEEGGTRTRVAFSQGGVGKSDEGTLLTGRVTIGEDFSLTISSVQPADELVFFCQVTAGPNGVGDASTMLKVFCESAMVLLTFLNDLKGTFSKRIPLTNTSVINEWTL